MDNEFDKPVKLPSRLRTLSYFFFLALVVIGVVFLFSSNTQQRLTGLALVAGGLIGVFMTRIVHGFI